MLIFLKKWYFLLQQYSYTNKLVKFYDGADGLKTGFTATAGYCLTATAYKNGMRLISVVMGEDTSQNRTTDTVSLLNYGFNTYKLNTIVSKDTKIGKIKINKGKIENVELQVKDDVTELLSVNKKQSNYTFNIKINSIKAPVKKNSVVGTAEIIDNEGNIIKEVEIIVKEDIKQASFLDYLKQNLKFLTSGS